MSLATHILFLLLGLVLPLLLFLAARQRRGQRQRVHWSPELKVRLYYGNGLLLCGLALMVLIVWYFSGRTLAELGLGWGAVPYDPVAVTLLLLFLLFYPLDVFLELGDSERRRSSRESLQKLGFLPTTGRQYLHFLFLAVCAGVCEEIVYRGFMITYLREMLDTAPLATLATLLLPAAAFGLGHLYQERSSVVKVVLMAVLFGFFFLRTGTLWPLILLHTAVDAVGGLVSWYLEE